MRHVFGLVDRIRNYLTSAIIVTIEDPTQYSKVEESAKGGALSNIGNTSVQKIIFHHGNGSYVRWWDYPQEKLMEIKRLASDRFSVKIAAANESVVPGPLAWNSIVGGVRVSEFDIRIGQFLQVKDSRGRWLSVTRIRHRNLKHFELIK